MDALHLTVRGTLSGYGNMPNDKSDYKDTLEALGYKGTISAIVNKLNKIKLNTEDDILKDHLSKILKALEEALRHEGKVKAKGLNLSSTMFKDVIPYCDKCIKSAKPTWQIIAEQHGWSAPNSKV